MVEQLFFKIGDNSGLNTVMDLPAQAIEGSEALHKLSEDKISELQVILNEAQRNNNHSDLQHQITQASYQVLED